MNTQDTLLNLDDIRARMEAATTSCCQQDSHSHTRYGGVKGIIDLWQGLDLGERLLDRAGITKKRGVPVNDLGLEQTIRPILDRATVDGSRQCAQEDGYLGQVIAKHGKDASYRFLGNEAYEWQRLNDERNRLRAEIVELCPTAQGTCVLDDFVVARTPGSDVAGCSWVYDGSQGEIVWGQNWVELHYADERYHDNLEVQLRLPDSAHRLSAKQGMSWADQLARLWKMEKDFPEGHPLYLSHRYLKPEVLTGLRSRERQSLVRCRSNQYLIWQGSPQLASAVPDGSQCQFKGQAVRLFHLVDPQEKEGVYLSPQTTMTPQEAQVLLDEVRQPSNSKLRLSLKMLARQRAMGNPVRDLVFDGWYTQAIWFLRELTECHYRWLGKCKSNMELVIDSQTWTAGELLQWDDLPWDRAYKEGQIAKLIGELPGCGPVSIFVWKKGRIKRVLISNDLDMTTTEAMCLWDRRWTVEEYNKTIKQVAKVASPRLRSEQGTLGVMAFARLTITLEVLWQKLHDAVAHLTLGDLVQWVFRVAAAVKRLANGLLQLCFGQEYQYAHLFVVAHTPP